MTAQSPESIAEEIVCEWYGTSGCQQIYEGIVKAIKAERENNRLVLPERRVMNFEWGNEHENSSVFGFNRCLDEIIRLNPDLVRSNEEKKI